MNNNPFLTALKVLATGFLAFFVFMAFWQRNHFEDQMAGMTRENSALTERVGEMSRRVDAMKTTVDRLDGATRTLVDVLKGGSVHVGPGGDGGNSTPPPPPAADPQRWDDNAALDAGVDPARPVGKPGRYRNFLSLDPDPPYPAEAAGHDGGEVGMVLGRQERTFNSLNNTSAGVQENIELAVGDSPASEQWRDPYKYAPALCWRIEVSPDYREYTLFFRRDAVWQAPAVDLNQYPHLKGVHPVTAKDFKFTIDTILNPQTECAPIRAYFDDCAGVTLVDDFTAVVRWKRTVYHSIAFTLGRVLVPEFLYAYDATGTRFPPETFGQQFNEHYYNRIGMPGCGPYRMLPYDGGEWITLARNEDWYGIRDGVRYPMKTIKLLVYQESETPFLKLKAGELGILGLTASQWKKSVIDETDPTSPFKDGRMVTYKGLRPQYRFVGWKNTHPLFTDKSVRKALALACNVAAIAEKIFIGRLVPMASPIYPGSPSADPTLAPLPYDPAEAARLLDAAGWKLNPTTGIREKEVELATKDGSKRKELRRFEFEMIMISGDSEIDALVAQYRNDLRALGVVLTPVPLEWSLYLERLHDRNFEASLAGWGTNAWDQDFDQIWHSRQIQVPKGSNSIEFANAEVDRLSDQLRTEMDVAKRVDIAKRIGRIIFEEQPCCFLGWLNAYGAHWSWLQNPLGHQFKTRPFIRTFPMWVKR